MSTSWIFYFEILLVLFDTFSCQPMKSIRNYCKIQPGKRASKSNHKVQKKVLEKIQNLESPKNRCPKPD